MRSWFSIHEVAPGRFIWVLYSGNCHQVLRSERTFNAAHHARAAARRLHRIAGNASFNYGLGFRHPKGWTVRP